MMSRDTDAENFEDPSVSPISRLPPELLVSIFRHCSVPDLALSIQHVCRHWRQQVQSSVVWQNQILEISVDKRRTEYCVRILSQVPFLQAARVNAPQDVIPILWRKCPNIRRLCLYACNTLHMHHLLYNLHHLRHMDVCVKLHPDIERVFSGLESSLNLSVLILRECEPVGTLPLTILETCPYLQHILISKFKALDRYIEGVASLHTKDIAEGNPITNSLRTVYFVGCIKLSTDVLYKLTSLQKLQCLTLRYNKFTQDELKETLFSKQHDELAILDLGYSFNLTCSMIEIIAHHCASITNLSLMRCAVTDDVLDTLMNRLPELQILNLHGTQVTSAKLSKLSSYLPNLIYLNLYACRKVDHNSLKSLVKDLPNLLVVNHRISHVAGAHVRSYKSPFLEQRNCL